MSFRNLSHCLLAALLGWFTVAAAGAAESPFVRTAEIEPDIQFWTRVYTEVTTNGGLVHDERNLGVVYEVISFPESLTPGERSKRVDAAKDKYRAILKRLASGNSTGSA